MKTKAEMMAEMQPIINEWESLDKEGLLMDMFDIVLDEDQVRRVYVNVLNQDELK